MDDNNKQNVNYTDGQNSEGDAQAVVAIVELLTRRLDREDLLAPKDREAVSYRLAEIMMCAKELYTNRLNCLIASDEERAQLGRLGSDTPAPDPEKPEEPAPITVFEDLAYTRMHLIRLRDLIADFDASFMEAMANQREEDGNEETWLQDSEWLDSELEDNGEREYYQGEAGEHCHYGEAGEHWHYGDEEGHCHCKEDEDPWN